MSAEEIKPDGKLWLLVILVLLGFVTAITYFAGQDPLVGEYRQARLSNPLESRQTRLYTVYYNAGVFSPTNLRIHAGDSVKFQNDSDQALHVVSDSENNLTNLVGFDSVGDIPSRAAFTYTFSKAGTFGYSNSLNRNERGTVIVRPN